MQVGGVASAGIVAGVDVALMEAAVAVAGVALAEAFRAGAGDALPAVDGASAASKADAAGVATAPVEVAALVDDGTALLEARVTDRGGLEWSALVSRHAIPLCLWVVAMFSIAPFVLCRPHRPRLLGL